MKIFLIRHGESEANAKGIDQGQKIDTGLSEKGKEQARKIAERLKNEKIETIYSSDLKRAKETAKKIAKFHNLEVIQDKRLREYDFGDWMDLFSAKEKHEGEWTKQENVWEGWKVYKLTEAKKQNILPEEVKIPGGESQKDILNRVNSFLEDVNKKHSGNIVVVAHSGANKIFFGAIKHTPLEKIYDHQQTNTGLNELEFIHGKWHVHKINCTKHLE